MVFISPITFTRRFLYRFEISSSIWKQQQQPAHLHNTTRKLYSETSQDIEITHFTGHIVIGIAWISAAEMHTILASNPDDLFCTHDAK